MRTLRLWVTSHQAALCWAIAAGLAWPGLVSFPIVDRYPGVLRGLPYPIALLAVLISSAIALFGSWRIYRRRYRTYPRKGRSPIYRDRRGAISHFLVVLAGSPLLIAGHLILLNAIGDRHAPQHVTVPILNARSSSSARAGTTYEVLVPDWSGSEQAIWIAVERATYQRQPSHLRLTTKPGLLGYEWIQQIH